MTRIETSIPDLYIIEPTVYGDSRGYFFESFSESWFREHIADTTFVQDNESKSARGVVRGLHFQKPPMAQAKLVRVIEGEVIDVAVDLRKDSPTYGHHVAVKLTGDNKRQLFVPRGFGHGFAVLSETAIFSYKVDNFYAPETEGGIAWNDPMLNIEWELDVSEVQLSAKDLALEAFSTFKSPF